MKKSYLVLAYNFVIRAKICNSTQLQLQNNTPWLAYIAIETRKSVARSDVLRMV